MNKDQNDTRIGFHSIESILTHNPHKIKKVLLPANRDDERLNNLVKLLQGNNIPFEISNKIKQEPEAKISIEKEMNFRDLKNFLDSESSNNPLIPVSYTHLTLPTIYSV